MFSAAKTSNWLIGLGLLCAGLVFLIWIDSDPVAFESLESKSPQNGPVFNSVSFKSGWDKDIWLMQQSHHGLKHPKKDWDKIAIVVDKTKSVKEARFFQLEPGSEEISMQLKPVPLKASCYMCHPSGPRVIRPNYASSSIQPALWQRLKILAWNIRIKSYGPMQLAAEDKLGKFRLKHPAVNQDLKLQGCVGCHDGKGPLSRNMLTLQNKFTIKFMVEQKLMPPPGFSLSSSEMDELWKAIGESPSS